MVCIVLLDHVTYSKFLVYSCLRDIGILKDKWKAKSDPGLSQCKHNQKVIGTPISEISAWSMFLKIDMS
jgi:hypothetical protein